VISSPADVREERQHHHLLDGVAHASVHCVCPTGRRYRFGCNRHGAYGGGDSGGIDTDQELPARAASAAPPAKPSGLRPLLAYTSYEGYLDAFDVEPDKLPDIYLIAPDGRRAGRVTRTIAWELNPVWSPDGTRIAYARGGWDTHAGSIMGPARTGIWVANADGTRAHRLAGVRTHATGASGEYLYDLMNDGPAWSPDGRWIAFRRATGPIDAPHDRGIYVVRVSGGREQRLVRYWSPFAWSPDSKHLAVARKGGLDIIRLGDRSIRRLAPGSWSTLDWSPDGTSIAATDGRRLWIIDVATARMVSYGGLGGGLLAPLEYSPDGRSIAVGTRRGLYIFHLGDRRTNRALVRAINVESLSWSPTGQKIAFSRGDLWIVAEDGSGLRRLTHTGRAMDVDWRP
jgi:Tol biopolymer transport system component